MSRNTFSERAPRGRPGEGERAASCRTSVIIVNWNGRHHLTTCLPALEAQTLAPDEIIVVDNASTDDSVQYLRRDHPRVKVVLLPHNLGFAGGNVAGLEQATGNYIILLNNDTRPLADWLERIVTCADELPDAGVIASHLTDWEGRNSDSAGDGYTVTGWGFKRNINRPATSAPVSSPVFSACAGAALYKRSMLDEVGFFDPDYFMNAEDTDLAFRARLLGWEVRFCAGAVVRHRIGASQGILSNQSVYYNVRNHILTYAKCMPLPLILKYAFPSLADLFRIWLRFTLRRQGAAFTDGLVAALRLLPDALAERRRLQTTRRISARELELSLSRPGSSRRQRVAPPASGGPAEASKQSG